MNSNLSAIWSLHAELSLVAVLLVLFLADLFRRPEGNGRWFRVLACVLMAVQIGLDLTPDTRELFGGMYVNTPFTSVVKSILSAGTLLVFLLYLPLTILIPSSSGLATLSIPVVAPLGKFAGVGGDLVVTAFQSASGLVNILTPTAAVVMGALALGHVSYDRWLKYVWKLMAVFFLLALAFLAAGTALG